MVGTLGFNRQSAISNQQSTINNRINGAQR
jgi:hypothetical protein